jgi:hypothetical protein
MIDRAGVNVAIVDTRAHMIKLTETREITPYLWVHPHFAQPRA